MDLWYGTLGCWASADTLSGAHGCDVNFPSNAMDANKQTVAEWRSNQQVVTVFLFPLCSLFLNLFSSILF